MLQDLTDDLLWPRVLRAPALALSPSRLASGTVCAFLLAAVIWVAGLFTTPQSPAADDFAALDQGLSIGFESILSAVVALDPVGLARSVGAMAVLLRDAVLTTPLLSILLGLPLIAILAVAGGAISRSAAIEFAHGRFASRDDTLGYALRGARQLIGAVIAPVLLVTVLLLIVAVGGLLLSVPVLDIVGSVLYALALGVGGLVTIVLMLHVLALPLIIPALAIEGTDAFDAIQRSYAYVIGHPLRYLLYVLILLLLGALSATVFTLVARLSIEMTDNAAMLLTNPSAERVLTGEGEMGATKPFAHNIINIWRTAIELVAAGYIISLFFTSSALLYLVIRRICDGQDVNEVWEPVKKG